MVRTLEYIKNKGTFAIVASNNHRTELGIATTNSWKFEWNERRTEVMKQAALFFRIEIETHAKSVMREVWLELYAKFEAMSL